MGRLECVGDLDRELQNLIRREGPLREAVSQCLAFQVLHHQVVDSILVTDVVERADVRMAEAGNAFASRSKRSRDSGLLERCSGRTLTATMRSSRVSLAR